MANPALKRRDTRRSVLTGFAGSTKHGLLVEIKAQYKRKALAECDMEALSEEDWGYTISPVLLAT